MKKLLLKVRLFIISILGSAKAFEYFLEAHVDDAIEVVSTLKKILNSTLFATVMMFVPAKYADAIMMVKSRILHLLDEVAKDILVGDHILQMTSEQRLQALVDYLKTLSPAMQEAAFLKIASRYAMKSSDNLLKTSIVDTAVQTRFLQITEKIS